MKLKFMSKFRILGIGFLLLTACVPALTDAGSERINGKPQVVATTTIVGDVVAQVGGEYIDLTVLLPAGADPHSFDPTPKDIAKVVDAQIVFANGAGLEEFLVSLLEGAGATDKQVSVSDGIDLLAGLQYHDGEAAGVAAHTDDEVDPHVWLDPNNVLVWIAHIESKLIELDPDNANVYRSNAAAYREQVVALDEWIRQQVGQIPETQRKIVTDHTLFTYFNAAYGFTQVGAVIPGYSTLAEPSAQEIAALEDAIQKLGVQAVFVGRNVNPALAERVVEDTGTKLVYIYTGSLDAPGGEVDLYLEYIQYNVEAIVNALK